MAASAMLGQSDDAFLSVFPTKSFTTPTPEATPIIGTISSPGRSFGGFNNVFNDPAASAVKFSRAWSAATRYLSLSPVQDPSSKINPEVIDAFNALLAIPAHLKDLLAWYENEMSLHFRHLILPNLPPWQDGGDSPVSSNLVSQTVRQLQDTHTLYLSSIASLTRALSSRSRQHPVLAFAKKVEFKVTKIFSHSLPRQKVQKALASAMYQHMKFSLEPADGRSRNCTKQGDCHCNLSLGNLPVASLHAVGLGGALGERAFAHAVNKLLQGPAIERRCLEVDWTGYSSVIARLQNWIRSYLTPFVEHTLALLTGSPNLKLSDNDSQQFMATAVASLGRQRTHTLFEYVNYWPESQGAILDIKEYLTKGQLEDKAHVCACFSSQILQRLLHSGASTSEILSMYINVIHAFRTLDSRGVLLEKVAGPMRTYLRGRDDTVRIIAESLLMDNEGDYGDGNEYKTENICQDIPAEVARSALEGRQDDGMLHWNDMDWMPDPIDAGADFKASRSEDVVAYILGLFDQEDFINEVRNVLARHLLEAKETEYNKATRLIELLKARLDPTKLQAVEVMLKDVRDSVSINKRINPAARYNAPGVPTPQEVRASIPEEGIALQTLYQMFEARIKQPHFLAILNTVAMRRNERVYPKKTRLQVYSQPPPTATGAEFRVQIISKNFWPDLSTDEFILPPSLQRAQETFEERFSQQGGQRKLEFRPALGRVSVELELEDRVFKETGVSAWKASLVYAFSHEKLEDADTALSADQLAESLQMEKDLVMSGIQFWVGKKILYQSRPGFYSVLERLNMDTGMSQAVEPTNDDISAVRTQKVDPMFATFVTSMLQNIGPKEIGGMMGIASMLKMVNPTYAFSEEELLPLLMDMERKGQVSRNGDLWKAA